MQGWGRQISPIQRGGTFQAGQQAGTGVTLRPMVRGWPKYPTIYPASARTTNQFYIPWLIQVDDTVTVSDAVVKNIVKPAADSVTLSDAVVKKVTKPAADSVTLSDAVVKNIGKNPADTVTLSDIIAKKVTKPAADSVTLSDAVGKNIMKPAADSVTLSDAVVKNFRKIVDEAIPILDDTIINFSGIVPPPPSTIVERPQVPLSPELSFLGLAAREKRY